jgi:hypothetical protein
MNGVTHARSSESAAASPIERIIMTVILWAAIVGLAVIVLDYVLAAHP